MIPSSLWQVVPLREHLVSGSMVMTKAAVREEVSRASPTLQSHFTGTEKNLFDLCDLLDPFGLIAGGSQSHRERRLFFPLCHLFNILPPSRTRAFVCTACICLLSHRSAVASQL